MQEKVRNPARPKKFLLYSLAIAAGLSLIISGILIYNFATLSAIKIFNAHYSSYELKLSNEKDNPPLTAVEKAYSEKNYVEIRRIHDAGEDSTVKGEFLCGAASLEFRDYAKAIKSFNEVLKIKPASIPPGLEDASEYYLALAYIGNGDYDFALPILRKIQDEPDHQYHKKVPGRLLRQVKMLKWR